MEIRNESFIVIQEFDEAVFKPVWVPSGNQKASMMFEFLRHLLRRRDKVQENLLQTKPSIVAKLMGEQDHLHEDLSFFD